MLRQQKPFTLAFRLINATRRAHSNMFFIKVLQTQKKQPAEHI
jgi:hypothetical protein